MTSALAATTPMMMTSACHRRVATYDNDDDREGGSIPLSCAHHRFQSLPTFSSTTLACLARDDDCTRILLVDIKRVVVAQGSTHPPASEPSAPPTGGRIGGWGARRRRRPPAGIGFSGLGAIGSRKERADGERVVARRKIITLDRSIRSSGNADVDKARQENKGERQGDNQHLLRSRAHHQLIPRPATGRRTHTRGRSSRG